MAGNKGLDPEIIQDVLDMTSLLDTLKGIDLGKLAEEREGLKTPVEKRIEALRSNRKVTRILKGKRKKQHWKTTAAKRRKYFMEVVAPKRSRATADLLTSGEGWYTYLVESWKKHGMESRITREEFLDHIYPEMCRDEKDGTIGERGRNLPIFCRYNRRKPVSLENVYVLDQSTRRVMFDGAEHKLIRLGYCLPRTDGITE